MFLSADEVARSLRGTAGHRSSLSLRRSILGEIGVEHPPDDRRQPIEVGDRPEAADVPEC
jgi:hypothetical protein